MNHELITMTYESQSAFHLCPRYLCPRYEMRAQKPLIMQNEPNLQKARTNVNAVLTNDYDNLDTWSTWKNEPKTNPKRTQYKPKMNPNEPKMNPNEPKQTQFQTRSKIIRAKNNRISLRGIGDAHRPKSGKMFLAFGRF